MKTLKYFIVLIGFISWAQPTFEAKVRSTTVAQNERFQVNFEMNFDGDNFVLPEIKDFDIVGGPFQSVQNSWINGVRSFAKSYGFMLLPKRKGKFVIPSATIEYKGEIVKTAPLTISVTDAKEVPKNPNDPNYKVGEGLHLVAEVSNNSPYINEPVTIVYKLYFDPRFVIRNAQESKTPKYKGFFSELIEIPELKAEKATFKGQQFGMVVWRKVVLYPLEKGTQQIEPLALDIEVQVPTGRRNFFMEPEYVMANKTISAGDRSITVKDFPERNKPADFTGAIGENLKLDVSVNKKELKANESLELKLRVSGKGNIKLFSLPEQEFASVFEVFEPKHNEKVKVPLSGMNGFTEDIYTLIPQYKGKYTIKPITFSYFDLKQKTYRTLSSDSLLIDVTEGPVQEVIADKGNLKTVVKTTAAKSFLGQLQVADLKPKNPKDFWNSKLYYLLLLLPLFLIPLVVFLNRRKAAWDADVVGNKKRKNNRLARKYLSSAKKQIGNKIPFYLAIERALHTFLKAKLQIETTEMDKENIAEILSSKNVEEETNTSFIALMEQCELARYAPDVEGEMEKQYQQALNVITDLNQQLKS